MGESKILISEIAEIYVSIVSLGMFFLTSSNGQPNQRTRFFKKGSWMSFSSPYQGGTSDSDASCFCTEGSGKTFDERL